MISPAPSAMAWTPRRRPVPACATSLIRPRVSRLTRARGTYSRGRVRQSQAIPAAMTWASVMPTAAIAGGVKVTRGGGGGGGVHGEALSGERAADDGGSLGFLEWGRPVKGFHDRDLGAETGEQLALLQADRVTADHEHRGGQRVLFHRGGRGQVPGLLQAVDRGRPRRRPGRDQELLRLHPRDAAARPADLQPLAPAEGGLPLQDLPPV